MELGGLNRELAATAAGRSWFRRMATTVTTHRQPLEYLGGVQRFPVPEEKIPWSVDYPGYQPVDYTAPRVLSRPAWADPDIRSRSLMRRFLWMVV